MIYLIKNATIGNEGQILFGHIIVENEIIKEIIYSENAPEIENAIVIDANKNYVIPGIIDDQVHFRDFELSYKADIYTESKAAVAGGITSYMDMPNTKPQTVTQELLAQKFELASQKSLANYSFYLGATNDNLEEILKIDPNSVCGVKVFMGSSTGNMLVDNEETLIKIFSKSPMLIATHCEDEMTVQQNLSIYKKQFGDQIPIQYHPLIRSSEACYKSSSFAVGLAKKYQTRLHVLHISTEKELELFDHQTPAKDKKITSEVCVHHLWFDDSDYSKFGSLIKWNPAIKKKSDKEALRKGVLENKIDIIATDHAPHTAEEKNRSYLAAPSGGPLVQHSLLVMLELYHRGTISLEKIIEKMCHTPADIFKISKRGYIRKGYWADLVIVDLNKEWKVTKDNILYKCKWSPFEGTVFHSSITHTFVNGNLVFENGIFHETVKGKPLYFDR
jgi:dihydroorotase